MVRKGALNTTRTMSRQLISHSIRMVPGTDNLVVNAILSPWKLENCSNGIVLKSFELRRNMV